MWNHHCIIAQFFSTSSLSQLSFCFLGSNDVEKLAKSFTTIAWTSSTLLKRLLILLMKLTGLDKVDLERFIYFFLYKPTSPFPTIFYISKPLLTKNLLQGVLADGREIAIKTLYFNNRHKAADFYNKVNIISSVEHKNLVRLLGCSCSGPESWILTK